MKKRLIIVDISSFIFRAFFAIRPMNAPDGTPTNAVYGVLTMLLKLLKTYEPTHFVLARDTSGPSFRNELYPDYKANRGPAPEELVPQFKIINDLVEALKIPNIALKNYEADDIIGSLAVQYKDHFEEVLIASGDKDLMQFVDGKVKMLDTMKEKIFGINEVHEKMGVYPEQIMDYLSLLGDSSDNIPGVKGIGAKGAAKLLEEYKDLDTVIENIENLTNKRAKTALEKGVEDAHLSRSLVRIETELKLELSPEQLKYSIEPNDEVLGLLDELNFKSLKQKISSNSSAFNETRKTNTFIKYDVIKKEDNWNTFINSLEKEDQLYVELLKHPSNRVIGLATGEQSYIVYENTFAPLSKLIDDLLKNEQLFIVSNSFKELLNYSSFVREKNFFDLKQGHFSVEADRKHDLTNIAKELIDETVLDEKSLLKETLEQEQSVRNFEFALAKRAYAGIRVYPWLQKKISEFEVNDVFDLDQRLIPILARMENSGVKLNVDFFTKMQSDLSEQLEKMDSQIKSIADIDEINLKSPKQVRELLFDKLGLPVIKKTKTGPSTDSSVLETLDSMGESEIPGLILKFREIEKLQSTYVKTLPTLVDENSRIHTHYHQHTAATGRLSSDTPNLQNIPIKTENGRKIRKGFLPEEGCVFLGADYSQVELRLLAHCSKDKVMVQAFNNDEDIHSQTAASIFHVSLSDVTTEQRSYAKAINFGLMYGQSSFGLSQMLGISRKEAKDYIESYFSRFSSVKSYLDGLKEEAEQQGYTKTLYGRKRVLKDINSTNRMTKSVAERMAINTPIQGTAADIIKMAMVNISKELRDRGLKTKMILQVHDELIFNVPESEIDEVKNLVVEKMENVVELDIPLKVDYGIGHNWYELK